MLPELYVLLPAGAKAGEDMMNRDTINGETQISFLPWLFHATTFWWLTWSSGNELSLMRGTWRAFVDIEAPVQMVFHQYQFLKFEGWRMKNEVWRTKNWWSVIWWFRVFVRVWLMMRTAGVWIRILSQESSFVTWWWPGNDVAWKAETSREFATSSLHHSLSEFTASPSWRWQGLKRLKRIERLPGQQFED